MQDNELRVLSVQGVRRLPYYLKFLKEMQAKGTAFVPAISIADSLGIYEVQVRKDLAAVSSSPGKPRVGFSVDGLIADIEHFLGYDNANLAALVGAGNLGKALLSYGGFAEYGLDIAAAFGEGGIAVQMEVLRIVDVIKHVDRLAHRMLFLIQPVFQHLFLYQQAINKQDHYLLHHAYLQEYE